MVGGWIRRWVHWVGGLAGGRAPDGRNGLALETLRGRFPDAPEHWLEAIAARSSEGASPTIPGSEERSREAAAPGLLEAAPVADRSEGAPDLAGRRADARFRADRGELPPSSSGFADRRADQGKPVGSTFPDAARRPPSVRASDFAGADRPGEQLRPTFPEAPPRVFHSVRFVPHRSRPGGVDEPAPPLDWAHAFASRTETVPPSLPEFRQSSPDLGQPEIWALRRTQAPSPPADPFPLRPVSERAEAPSWATPTTREPFPPGFARAPEAPRSEGPSPFAATVAVEARWPDLDGSEPRGGPTARGAAAWAAIPASPREDLAEDEADAQRLACLRVDQGYA